MIPLPFIGLLAVSSIPLIVMLLTGKAFNPARGMRPMIITRRERPGAYWISVGLCLGFLAIEIWIATARVSN